MCTIFMGPGQYPVAGPCQHGKEDLAFTKGGKFLD